MSGLPVIRMQALLHKAPLRSNIATVFEALRSAIGEIGDEYKIFGNSLHHVIAASSSNRNPHSQYADVKSVDILRDAVVPLTLGHLASIFGVLQTSWHSQLELFSQLSNLCVTEVELTLAVLMGIAGISIYTQLHNRPGSKGQQLVKPPLSFTRSC